MRHLKKFKIFESYEDLEKLENPLTFQNLRDIFLDVRDCGLEVADTYCGASFSLGDKSIVTDHHDFDISYPSFTIRLRVVKSSDQNERGYFYIDDNLFEELKSAISHTEREYDLVLNNIYLRMTKGAWFKDVDVMEKFINELPFAKKQSLKWITYIDITFLKHEDKHLTHDIS
jgi:hypothetical protein